MQRLTYGSARVQDLQCQTEPLKNGRSAVRAVLVDGRPCKPSERFWTSLQARFGFSKNIFKYFRHDEVFHRISTVAPNDRIRWCVEERADGLPVLLAVSNPNSALVGYDDLVGLLQGLGAEDVAYSNGVVHSRHQPRASDNFTIAGDSFVNKFVLDTPVDGFGRPSIYLSLLRQICSNGAVGFAPAFRSEIGLGRGGDQVAFTLTRALDGYSNEEGFAALRQRFETASHSWASVQEANRLYKTLVRLHHHGQVFDPPLLGGDGAEALSGSPARISLLQSFHRTTGDLSALYGLANLDSLGVKRQRTLPAACSVYDLLNFTTEVATHHATEAGNRVLQGLVGELLTTEYDLEGTKDQFADHRDFFIGDGAATATLATLHQQAQ